MYYPTLTPEETSRDFIEAFGGYNHNPRIGENEFYDMENLSSDSYPLLATRAKRGAETSSFLVGMLYRSSLYTAYVTASRLFLVKDGATPPMWNFPTTYDATVQRKLVMMGAYLIVLPDKKYINVEKYNPNAQDQYPDKGDIEAEVVTGATTNMATIQPCNEDGSVVTVDYAGDTEPEGAKDGYIWLDTSTDPATVKKYFASNSMWSPQLTGYVKFSMTDIGEGFSVGDGVNVAGLSASNVKFNDGVAIVKAKPDGDNALVLSANVEITNEQFTFFEPVTIGTNKTVIKVGSSTAATANQYKDSVFLFGKKKAVCTSHPASTARQGWVVDNDTDFTTLHRKTVTTKNQAQSVGPNSPLYIPLANDEDFADGLTGRTVRIGDYERKITTVMSNRGGSCIYLDGGVDAPASTTVYLLKIGDVAGEYEIELTLDKGVQVAANTSILIDPDFTISQTALVTLSRKMPEMDFVIESKNRLWGCKYGDTGAGETLNEIYASKLGDFKNWRCYEGLSTDSYAASCGTDGNWTGAINYFGSPLFFKENYIHTVYGSYPEQYQINSVTARGVKAGCGDSLAIMDNTLMYLSNHGVCAYNGSLPSIISDAFGDIRYKEAKAAAYNGKYYISMKEDKATNPPYVLMVFDSKRGLWHKEENPSIEQLCATDNDVIYITADNKRGSLFAGTETVPIDWYAETGIYGLSMIDSKYISRLNIRLSMDQGATFRVSIQYNSSGVWEKLCYITGTRLRPFTLPIKPRRCDHFRLRLEGKGGVKIYSISKTISQGSDL